MICKRIFIERRPGFDIECQNLKEQIQLLFNLELRSLRYFIIYDIFNIEEEICEKAINDILSEPNRDIIHEDINLSSTHIAIESLPGQFDQRADSAVQCIKLIHPASKATVTSGYLFMFDNQLSEKEYARLKKFYINKVESREKDLMIFQQPINEEAKPVSVLNGFIYFNEIKLQNFLQDNQLAMSINDLKYIQEYFLKEEKRDPRETEIKVLDTYWSDHCRHTTFETELSKIVFEPGNISTIIQSTFNDYLETRNKVGIHKLVTLMDIATINTKLELKNGNLDDLEISDEVNACSIYIDVLANDKKEKWLLMFKNETHNHPTEIEPFGGASTCIGGAIRDPLSGRSYVYGAMRITGAGDITRPIEETLEGKLPQRIISQTAAHGYSSYGNQVGIPTTYVNEVIHQNFIAKRMEVGAVIGAVKASDIIREKPIPGDFIILIGGKTGRDGIGGATGSSKTHHESSMTEASSEVQKGNAPEERKIQRLFRRNEVTRLIKKANDFGAGGVSVAIGELAAGIDIDLDKIPVKYMGINGTELAISESQERMAVVIDSKNEAKFIQYCHEENIEATVVAKVTEKNRLTMTWKKEIICDISRDFIKTSGIRQSVEVKVLEPIKIDPFLKDYDGQDIKQKILNMLKDNSVASMQGLSEMFDSTIGRTTVLSPFGGQYRKTKIYASVQRIPVKNQKTATVSIMAYGYDPNLCIWSPYHGAMYAVIDSISKVVSCGGNYKKIRLSFQEYFERLGVDPIRWQKPFSSLLGAYYTLKEFNLAAIGGKDSMSGSFKELDVPPTLISFAFTTENIKNIISPEFKQPNNYIYLVKSKIDQFYLPDFSVLKQNFDTIYEKIQQKAIISASPLQSGGLAETLIKASFGNRIGFKIQTNCSLFDVSYGSMIVESKERIKHKNFIYLGETVSEATIFINNVKLDILECLNINESTYKDIYPIVSSKYLNYSYEQTNVIKRKFLTKRKEKVFVLNPVFPGTNCEYDTEAAFIKEKAIVKTFVFNNQTEKDILESIESLAECISKSDILLLNGGFSSGDEPDGSGKFIASVLRNDIINVAIQRFLEQKKLILGICNGFQALIKSGLLPYGQIKQMEVGSPTLFKNDINRHVSKFADTKVSSINSPWLYNFKINERHTVAMSHGEGKFIIGEEEYKRLSQNNQIAFQYVDGENNITNNPIYNINGSAYAIEGVISEDGLILGKMGHSERYEDGLFQNIQGNKDQNIFKNAVNYFINGGTK